MKTMYCKYSIHNLSIYIKKNYFYPESQKDFHSILPVPLRNLISFEALIFYDLYLVTL